ncbi:MAG: hypothetical protein HYZ49_03200 [Chloroflexi bacterium]|nr:hypothetical protein [Chloroflexota bacterium]
MNTEQITLTTGEAPEIVIDSIAGDLRLSGWEQNEFYAETDDRKMLTAEQKNGEIRVTCLSDCAIRVPRRAVIKVAHVAGDARIKAIEGNLRFDHVSGDLVLRQVASVEAGQVDGDVSAKKIRGSLVLKIVGGDVSARGVAGAFAADQVGGDLYLRDAHAAARAVVGSDIILSLNFAPGQEYHFQSGSDIICRAPSNTSASFNILSGGDIAVDVFGATVEGNSRNKMVTAGNGAAKVNLRAGGDVSLSDIASGSDVMGEVGDRFGEEFGMMADVMAEELSAQIEAQIESQMADFEKQLTDRLAGLDITMGASRVNADEIAARARRAAERVSDSARRRAEAAERRAKSLAEAAERRAEAARERAERKAERHAAHATHAADRSKRSSSSTWRFDFTRPLAPKPPVPPRPPVPPVEPVSDEERMSILKMVEQGKITVAEAEKLLAAIEGR